MKKIILYILILIIVAFLVVIYIYKDNILNSRDKILKIETTNKTISTDNNIDVSLYNNNIKDEYLKKINFKIIINNIKPVFGTITINDNGNIVINDESNYKEKIIDEYKFKSLYMESSDNFSITTFYALTTDDNIYRININNGNVNDLTCKLIDVDGGVSKFTDLKFKWLYNLPSNSIIVLTKSNKLYDVVNEIYYDENMTLVFYDYIIFGDNSFSTFDKRLVTDEKGNKLYVKYVMYLYENYNEGLEVYIVTTDNQLLYKDDIFIYIYKSKIKNIEKKDIDSYNIQFEDGSNIEVKAIFDGNSYSIPLFEE